MAFVPLSNVRVVTFITPVVLTIGVEIFFFVLLLELIFFLSFFESLLIRASVRSEGGGESFLRRLSGFG